MSTGEEHFTVRDEAVRIYALLLAMETETYESVEDEAKALYVSSSRMRELLLLHLKGKKWSVELVANDIMSAESV